jgi:hypothetical protein
MNERVRRRLAARLLAMVIAPILALATIAGAFADDEPSFSKEPRTVLHDLAKVDDNNIVAVFNEEDYAFKTRGVAEIDVIQGPDVVPGNVAWAQSTCVACNGMAVAFQIALYEPGATNVSPENAAVALNIACPGCFTYARAHQIVIPVENAQVVAENAQESIDGIDDRLDRALQSIKQAKITLEQFLAEIQVLIVDLRALASSIESGELAADSQGEVEDDEQDLAADRSSALLANSE